MASDITLKRIITMTDEASGVDDSQYFLTDSSTGTKKLQASAVQANEAQQFSTSAAYDAGDYVRYNGKLYKFTADHAAGVWTGSDAVQVTLGGELTDLKADLEQLEPGLSEDAKQALLACFDNVAWKGTDGQTYYNALYSALYSGTWAITNHLTKCTTNNSATSIDKNGRYTATLTADTGYTLDGASVIVTMGGIDVTATVYSEGAINISSVKGNVVISAVAVSESVPSGYTRYDYITLAQSVGNQAQENHILLKEYTNLNNYNYEFDFSVRTDVTASVAVFGGRYAGGINTSMAFYAHGNNMGVHCHGVNINDPQRECAIPGYKNHAIYKNNSSGQSLSTVSVNGNTPSTIAWGDNAAINAKLCVCANSMYSTITTAQGIVYGGMCGEVVVTDSNDVIVNRYIPCVRDSDNVIGMYDTVDDIFYCPTNTAVATIGGASCIWSVGNWAEMPNTNSISATFTQGSDVFYTFSDLSELKSNLVVVANYADETTATLSDTEYTLSGVLEEGTNTITVNYAGKTATFTVADVVGINPFTGSYTEDVSIAFDDSVNKLRYWTAENRISVSLVGSGDNTAIRAGGTSISSALYPFKVPANATKLVLKTNTEQWSNTMGQILMTKYVSSDWDKTALKGYVVDVNSYDISSINDGNLYVAFAFRRTPESNTVNDIDRSGWVVGWV